MVRVKEIHMLLSELHHPALSLSSLSLSPSVFLCHQTVGGGGGTTALRSKKVEKSPKYFGRQGFLSTNLLDFWNRKDN